MTNGRTHRTSRLPRPSTWNPESLLVAAALVLLVAGCARDAPPAGEPALGSKTRAPAKMRLFGGEQVRGGAGATQRRW